MPLEATALVMQKHPIKTSSLPVFVCHQVTGFFMPPELVAPFFPTKCGLWYLLWHRSSVKAIYIKSKWCFEDGTWGTSASQSFIILSPAVDEAWCYKGGKENPIKHLLNSFRVFFFCFGNGEDESLLFITGIRAEPAEVYSLLCQQNSEHVPGVSLQESTEQGRWEMSTKRWNYLPKTFRKLNPLFTHPVAGSTMNPTAHVLVNCCGQRFPS